MRIWIGLCLSCGVTPLALAAADDRAQAWRDIFTGLWFFGVMIVGVIVLGILRLRDGRLGLSREEIQARARKRMPFALIILVAAVTPLIVNL
jgi:heme/copper-type cytochrome/quinol oxidase subunit 2